MSTSAGSIVSLKSSKIMFLTYTTPLEMHPHNKNNSFNVFVIPETGKGHAGFILVSHSLEILYRRNDLLSRGYTLLCHRNDLSQHSNYLLSSWNDVLSL